MNERIFGLEKQADEYADSLGLAGDEWCNAQSTRFALLIVRECADFLKDTMDDHFAAEQLIEHFGVNHNGQSN